MKFSKVVIPTLFVFLSSFAAVRAADKWFDINGTTPGGGPDGFGFYDGAWDTTTSNWNTDPTGVAAPTTFANGDIAHFYAGNDPTAFGGITASGAPAPGGMEIEEGKVQLIGTIAMGANPWKIDNGAEFVISNLNQVTFAAPGSVLTLDGGKFTNNITGLGSGIMNGTNSQIQLTTNGGTISTPNGGPTGFDSETSAYSIMVYTNSITMASGVTSATLHKTGHGELRAFGGWNFTNLDVQQGLYRINGAAGGGETGFGDATGTVTAAGGAVENTSQGAALGTSIGITSPATRSFVLSGVGATPDTAITISAPWVINGPISGPGGFILNGWERGDAGAIIGSQTQTLTLGGTNTYGGTTAIGFGTLIATGGNAIPNTSQVSISTRSLWGNGTQSTFNTAVFRVDASETVEGLAGGNSTRGVVNVNGAGVTLQLNNVNDGSAEDFAGNVIGAGSIVVNGEAGAVQSFSGAANTYSGSTKVQGGEFDISQPYLADANDVLLVNANGAHFGLNFTGTDTIRSLFIDGVSQAVGTWGGTGSGAAHISALLSGTGLLNVTTLATGGVAGDYNNNGVVDMADYVLWRNGGPLQNDATPGVDPADYDVWRANFGKTPASGSGLSAGAAVPEPATLALVLLGGLGLMGRRRDR